MKNIDERIEEITRIHCQSSGCEVLENHSSCSLSKELRKFASEIVKEIVPEITDGYEMYQIFWNACRKEVLDNARRIGIEKKHD